MLTTTGCFIIIYILHYTRTQIPWDDLKWDTWPLQYDTSDIFFDRLAMIVLNITNHKGSPLQNKIIATGVILDSKRILTSYNPFRDVSQYVSIDNILVTIFEGRIRNVDNSIKDKMIAYHISCGRQVVYLPDDQMTQNDWLGRNEIKHSPVHDLMVLRIKGEIQTFSDLEPRDLFFGSLWPSGVTTDLTTGAYLVELAKPGDAMIPLMKFASIDQNTIHLSYFDTRVDRVMLDCREGLPHYWGYFICIFNTERLPNLDSGAMLFSNDKLFGVGCLLMYKASQSILVFTDVRPYNELIMNACTDSDIADE